MKDIAGKINITIVVAIIVVQALLSVAVYFFVLRDSDPASGQLTTLERTEVEPRRPDRQPDRYDEPDRDRGRGNDNRRDDPSAGFGARCFIKDYAIWSFGDLVVNPAGDDSRFFMVTISFEYRQADKRLPDELKAKRPLFNDALRQYFSRLTVDELRNHQNIDDYKEDIMRMVNSMLIEGRITNVLFEQFVLQ
jgi:flagellar basal body-associated protein FliL